MLKTIAHALTPGEDAISMLKADHREVDALFAQFKDAGNTRTKLVVAAKICQALDLHDQLESKIFYPATKSTAKDAVDEINEGIVEHEAIRRLIKEIPTLSGKDEFFETKVGVLIEYVKHHVREEEHSMFPKIIESDVDLQKLGARMAVAKTSYLAKSKAKPKKAAPAKSGKVAKAA